MIKAIIGLGNPGPVHFFQRHNIGFRILDALAETYACTWTHKSIMDLATISINNHSLLLIKPQTFMNSSGKIVPFLLKQGINSEEILVIHDELEKPFGNISFKKGGSHKGHNGLKSIIEQCGVDFLRLRFGIGRPTHKEQVPAYVLHNFDQRTEIVEPLIIKAVQMITDIIT
jgi:PTH1 family peptidyl-tRNA hydrolase